MWSDDQCTCVKSFYSEPLAVIQEACEQTPNCTAINVVKTGGGNLRTCSKPVPIPSWPVSNWEGYYLKETAIPGSISYRSSCSNCKMVK